jgi:hypothetical protein
MLYCSYSFAGIFLRIKNLLFRTPSARKYIRVNASCGDVVTRVEDRGERAKLFEMETERDWRAGGRAGIRRRRGKEDKARPGQARKDV